MDDFEDIEREQARATADRAQMRGIEQKLSAGKPLYPDEEFFLTRGALPLLESKPQFREFSKEKQEKVARKLAKILEFSKVIERYWKNNDISFREHRESESMSKFVKSGSLPFDWPGEDLTEVERMKALELARGHTTKQEIAVGALYWE